MIGGVVEPDASAWAGWRPETVVGLFAGGDARWYVADEWSLAVPRPSDPWIGEHD